MARRHLYTYRDGDIVLEFSFADDDRIVDNKVAFRKLLMQASS